MSGSIQFFNPDPNILYKALSGTGVQEGRRNDLLLQRDQQAIGGGEAEMMGRAATGLLDPARYPDEASRAAAYPGAVAELQRYGFAKNAPSAYPGEAALRRVAALAVPAEKQYERGQNAAAGVSVGGAYGFGPGAPGTATGGAAPAGGGGGGVAGEIEPPARERALAVRDGLVKRGMDVETATGFAANALHESAANPNTGAGDRGASHGVFQWTADRYNAYIAKNGHPPDNAPLDEQLDFVMHELNGSESLAKGRIAQAQGVDGKAAEISAAFLRPKDTEAEMKRRAATALKLAGGWSQPVTAPQSDQAWLDNQAKTYPAMAGPNVNMQAGTQPPVAPAGGVAARTGGTDVAGPGAGSGGAPGAAAAPMRETYVRGADGSVQKALVPTDGSGPPVPVPPAASVASTASTQQSPAPTAPAPAQMPAELQTDAHNLTARDRAELKPMYDLMAQGRLPPVTFQNEVQQRQAANLARQDKWQAQEHTARTEAAAAAERDYQHRKDADAAARAGLPAGYKIGPDGKAMRIEGLPTETAPTPHERFQEENKLRDEFQKLTGDFRIVQTSYENIRSASKANDGAGDMSLLYNYVRLLDPTSVVRESEFATAAASGSFGERVQGAVGRVISGARLPETLRQSFIREGKNLYDNQLRSHNTVADQYERLAERNGMDPAKVVTRFARPQDDGPKVGTVEDGYRFKGGDPAKPGNWEKAP